MVVMTRGVAGFRRGQEVGRHRRHRPAAAGDGGTVYGAGAFLPPYWHVIPVHRYSCVKGIVGCSSPNVNPCTWSFPSLAGRETLQKIRKVVALRQLLADNCL